MNALFEIGQKVVCVDSKGESRWPLPLTEGKVYTILGMKIPCTCGDIICVDVGQRNPYGGQKCYTCGLLNNDINWWFDQQRFVPLDFDRQADEEIHQALKEDLKVKNFQDN